MSDKTIKNKIEDYVMASFDWSALEKSGFVQPIIVSKNGMVLDGAHRTTAARVLGKEIPAIILDVDIVMLDPNTLETWLDKLESFKNE
jgi:hypothetical protein